MHIITFFIPRNLAEVNRTVHDLVSLVGGTRQALEERMAWLSAALGGTDIAVGRLYLILWHTAFMLVAMLTCAFLSARMTTRLAVATLPPLNLAVAFVSDGGQELGPVALGGAIVAFVLCQFLFLSTLNYQKQLKGALQWTKSPQKRRDDENKVTSSPTYDSPISAHEQHFEYKSTHVLTRDSEEIDDFQELVGSPTPPLSRSGFYSNKKTRSRSNTPLFLNGSYRGACQAKTRVGTPCKLSSLPGRDFCYRHQSGDSVLG